MALRATRRRIARQVCAQGTAVGRRGSARRPRRVARHRPVHQDAAVHGRTPRPRRYRHLDGRRVPPGSPGARSRRRPRGRGARRPGGSGARSYASASRSSRTLTPMMRHRKWVATNVLPPPVGSTSIFWVTVSLHVCHASASGVWSAPPISQVVVVRQQANCARATPANASAGGGGRGDRWSSSPRDHGTEFARAGGARPGCASPDHGDTGKNAPSVTRRLATDVEDSPRACRCRRPG